MDLPDGFDRTLGDLGRIGYEAYGAEAGWKAYNGEPMPQWEELRQDIRTKWAAAAGAIAKALAEGVG